MAALPAFLVKLPLALLVFLIIAYAGTANRRIAGVLFTFPILNGVAIIASDEPVKVAEAIYPLVIFNCVLFATVISFPLALPPLANLPRTGKMVARILAWSAAWLAGAALITDYRAAIPGGAVLLAGALILAIAFIWLAWSDALTENTPPRNQGFVAFWFNAAGASRIAFFIATYAVLYFASHAAPDPKWVGMASALPLPGFFALASLVDDAEQKSTTLASLKQIRDTLFLGPLLVIPFNWTFSHALASVLPADQIALHYVSLFAMWAIAAIGVIVGVPRLAAILDRRQSGFR
jgi:hypothetical protein